MAMPLKLESSRPVTSQIKELMLRIIYTVFQLESEISL